MSISSNMQFVSFRSEVLYSFNFDPCGAMMTFWTSDSSHQFCKNLTHSLFKYCFCLFPYLSSPQMPTTLLTIFFYFTLFPIVYSVFPSIFFFSCFILAVFPLISWSLISAESSLSLNSSTALTFDSCVFHFNSFHVFFCCFLFYCFYFLGHIKDNCVKICIWLFHYLDPCVSILIVAVYYCFGFPVQKVTSQFHLILVICPVIISCSLTLKLQADILYFVHIFWLFLV